MFKPGGIVPGKNVSEQDRQKILIERIRFLEETRSFLVGNLMGVVSKSPINPLETSKEIFKWFEKNQAEIQKPKMQKAVAIVDGMLEEFQFEHRRISGKFVDVSSPRAREPVPEVAVQMLPPKNLESNKKDIPLGTTDLATFYDRMKDAMEFLGVRWADKKLIQMSGVVVFSRDQVKIEIKL